MAYGIKVAKPNEDVKTCDDKDLVFSSEWDTYKIREQVSLTIEVEALGWGGYGGTETYTHDYGFIPFVWSFYKHPDGYWLPDGISTLDTVSYFYINTSVNATEVIFEVTHDTDNDIDVVALLMEKII